MAYTFDNRVKYLVRFLYDIDNNGVLDKNDFDCMALRATIIETRGLYEEKLFQNNVKAMASLWNEFSTFADVNRDGKVTTEEFKAAIQKSIVGKNPKDFPRSLKAFITITFKSIDVNDIDNNGILEKNDFDCMALKTTILELKGGFDSAVFETNKRIMNDLWTEFAEFADFDKDGKVTLEEFKQAVLKSCRGRNLSDFPRAFKVSIANAFKNIDLNGDGLIGIDEYRMDCITRFAFSDVQEIDEAYNKLLTDADRRAGGINLSRYQELYAEFIANPDENTNAIYLFGPLQVL